MKCLPHKTLCIEDDRDTCELLRYALPKVEWVFAHTFSDGLKQIKRRVFGLYLLDNWLPDGSGITLCREIRRSDAGTPIIFVSGAAYATDHVEAMKAGASIYLDKPVELLQLERAMAYLRRLAELRNMQAKAAELAAVLDAVGQRLSGVELRTVTTSKREAHVREHLLRARAYDAFMKSGGTRASFDGMWTDMRSHLTTLGPTR